MEFTIIERNGGKVLLLEGYQYHKQKVYRNSSVIWYCNNRRKGLKCTGSVTTKDEQVVKEVQHIYGCKPDSAQNEIAVCIHEMKKQASTSVESLPKVYKENIKSVYDKGLPMVTRVPSFKSVKCSLYSARKAKLQVKRTVFKCIQDVEVPETYKDILLAEYRFNGSIILLFCLEESKKLLREIKEYFGDGTFKVAPMPFTQLYVIFGDIGSTADTTNVIPIFYALMADKKESTYLALFDLIKTTCSQWNPKKFHADFESGVTNALKKIIPNVVVKKCYYHFCKSIWKKSKQIGLKSKLHRRIVGLCTALSLLPADKIQDGWAYIQSACEQSNEKLNRFLKYMKRTWLKNEEFINEWCTFGERHRTNNVCENWNSQVNKKINKNYVTLAKLLLELKEDATYKIKLYCGLNKRKQIEIDKDILIISTQIKLLNGNITIGHFLEIHR